VTFSIEGMVGEEASRNLWNQFHITQRRVERPSAVRASCAYFVSDDDITRLAEAVDHVARGN
jgi:selenocysteine lyase/cysteine desulfurase